MKNFYEAGRGLLFLLLGCLFIYDSLAQSIDQSGTADTLVKIKALQIGDTIPEALWNTPLQVINHPDRQDTIRLADFRVKKVIILDFWATWCAPCVKSLSKLDTLQRQFSGDLAVVPVSNQKAVIVSQFIKDRGWNHISICDDTQLTRYFPHSTIPHQIWIRDDRVWASTGSEYTAERFITDALRGDNSVFMMKKEDLMFDPKMPLLYRLIDNRSQHQIQGIHSLLTGYQADLPFAREWWSGNSWMLTNFTIPALLVRAFADSIPQLNYRTRLIVDVQDSLRDRVVYPNHLEKYHRKIWLAENTYCYNAGSSFYSDKSKYQQRLKEELNSLLRNVYGMEGGIERRLVDMFELIVEDKEMFLSKSQQDFEHLHHQYTTDGSTHRYTKINAENLAIRLSGIQHTGNIPLLNRVLSDRIFTVSLHNEMRVASDLEGLNMSLADVGLKVRRKTDYLDMLVIRSSK